MDHFFQDIYGWWSEEDKNMYAKMVDKFSDGSQFVEIGSFKGRSSCSMAVEIINSGKQIKFDCVDTWEGSEEHREGGFAEDEDVLSKRLFDVFLQNIKPVCDIINPIQNTSQEASILYDDESIDFVFIDGSHDIHNVINDIQNWFPKVKKGGVLAGHDYGHQVKIGVDSFFRPIVEAEVITHTDNTWWLVNKTFKLPSSSEREALTKATPRPRETTTAMLGMIPLDIGQKKKLKTDDRIILWERG